MDGQSIDRLIMAKISVLWRDNCCIHNRTYKSTEFCVRRFDDVFLVRIFASREFYWLFEYAVVTLAVFICFVFHWLNSNLIRYNSYTFLPFMDFQFFFSWIHWKQTILWLTFLSTYFPRFFPYTNTTGNFPFRIKYKFSSSRSEYLHFSTPYSGPQMIRNRLQQPPIIQM